MALALNAVMRRGIWSNQSSLFTHNNVLEGFSNYVDLACCLPPSQDLFTCVRLPSLKLTGRDNAMERCLRKTIGCKIQGNGEFSSHKRGLQIGTGCRKCSINSPRLYNEQNLPDPKNVPTFIFCSALNQRRYGLLFSVLTCYVCVSIARTWSESFSCDISRLYVCQEWMEDYFRIA